MKVMNRPFMEAVDRQVEQASKSGALVPVQSDEVCVDDGGLPFRLRWVSSLAAKDAAKDAVKDAAKEVSTVAIPGGPRDPNFNPFKSPEPALTIGPIGEVHVAILNKFPICNRHLVLARREFEEQLIPLSLSDFAALAVLIGEGGGLGLYNGGTEAGASQRHKHVQWIPRDDGNASLDLYLPGLPADAPEHQLVTHACLAARHCFVRVVAGEGVSMAESAASMLHGFNLALAALDMQPGADGLLAPFNLLVCDGWMLVVPRSAECYEGVSIAAVAYGGTLYVRHPEQIELMRQVGPLAVLAAVGLT